MSLDSIVAITIDAQTTTPAQTGFGVPMVVAYHTHNTDLIRFYTSLAGMVADSFATTEPAYLAARAIFAQDPHPTRVAIGRLSLPSTQIIKVAPTAVNSTAYTVTINGVACTYTSDGSATVAEIVAGLVSAINGASVASVVTAASADSATTVTITSDTAGLMFSCSVNSAALLTRQDITADAGIATDLAAISLINDTWYGLIMTSQGKAEIIAAAAYIETIKKVFIATTGDSDVIGSGSGDVATALKTSAYARTGIIFEAAPEGYAGAAWLGEMLPQAPGSNTWEFKTLAGVTVDTLTETQRTNLTNKRCEFYVTEAGVNVTRGGAKTGSGEYIDVTIFTDWLRARMQERLFGILVNLPKLPFTDSGIALVDAAIRAQLAEAVAVGGLIDGTTQVVVPAAVDVSSASRAARTLTGVTFQGQLAGAIHSLTIQGTLTV